MTTRFAHRTLTALAASAMLGGCTNAAYDAAFNAADAQNGRARAVLDAQYAKGAAEDGRLTGVHFEGRELSGAGRDKLVRMAEGAGDLRRLRVSVDVPEAEADEAESMRLAVVEHLEMLGLRGDREAIDAAVTLAEPEPMPGGEGMAAVRRDRGVASASRGVAPAGLFGAQ